MKWIKKGFDDFSKGTLGNGGQNIYISANGILQRIFQYDVNGDGYPDLLFANSQSMGERPPVYLYHDPLNCPDYAELPSNGSYDAVMTDINGDGYDDLIIACQNNGAHMDITSIIYYGSPDGLSERYKVELPVPDATGVVAGDFNGDGKNDLVFLREHGLRVFYQTELGILPFQYTDIDLDSYSIAAADLDGDGCCDLYAKLADGSTVILWGSKEGLSLGCKTIVFEDEETQNTQSTTTPGRRSAYRGWKASILKIDGIQYLFRADKKEIYFYACDENRNVMFSFALPCSNAIAVAAGDLDSDGLDDLAVAVCRNVDETENSLVFWNKDGSFSVEYVTTVPSVSAQNVEIAPLAGDGTQQLILCQGGTNIMRSTQSYIFGFDSAHTCKRLATLESGDAMRIVSGSTKGGTDRQIAVINHETGRVRGDENIYIYLGGKDGYQAERRIELPGWAAVDGLMYDYNDDGKVDVLISNCSENAPHMDPGSYLYYNGPEGLKPENRIIIPTIRNHGAAVGDFRKCGYLDIAVGGYRNRVISIFHGGPNGYDTKNPTRIVLGPNPEGYEPPKLGTEIDIESDKKYMLMNEESAIYKEFGETRWVYTADFNGDGWLDLFISQIVGPYCYILWGGPEGFSIERMSKLATDGVASANAADLDGDGYLDLILAGHQSIGKSPGGKYESYITVYWGGPKGYQEHRKTQFPASCANSVTVGDFNGDGILDIYCTAYHNGRCRDINSYVYYGKKGGGYSINSRQELFNHSGSGCLAGDFNGDGYADIAIACHKGYGNHISESFIFWGGSDGLSEARKTILPTVGPHGMSIVDPGNVMNRGDNEYYYSEIYQVPADMTVKSASWEAEIPSSCWVQLQMRHGENETALKEAKWIETQFENGQDLSNLELKGGFIQYRLILGARCGCGTPRVTAVTIEFD